VPQAPFAPCKRFFEIRFLYVLLLGVGLTLHNLSQVIGGCLTPPTTLLCVMSRFIGDTEDPELAAASTNKRKNKPRLSEAEKLSMEGNVSSRDRWHGRQRDLLSDGAAASPAPGDGPVEIAKRPKSTSEAPASPAARNSPTPFSPAPPPSLPLVRSPVALRLIDRPANFYAEVGVIRSAPRLRSLGPLHWRKYYLDPLADVRTDAPLRAPAFEDDASFEDHASPDDELDILPMSSRIDLNGEKYFEWTNLFRIKDDNTKFVFTPCEGATPATLSISEKKIDLYDRLRRMWLYKKHGKIYKDNTSWQKKWHSPSNVNNRTRARQEYKREQVVRWEGLIWKIKRHWKANVLGPIIVKNHEMRKNFAVSMYLGLERQDELPNGLRILVFNGPDDELAGFMEEHKDQVRSLGHKERCHLVGQGLLRGSTLGRKKTPKSPAPGASVVGDGDGGVGAAVSPGPVKPYPENFVTYNGQTVSKYVQEFNNSNGTFLESLQGHHVKVKWLLDNEDLRKRFEGYVLANGNKKGEKNMTERDLLRFVNEDIFKVGKPGALLSKGVCSRTLYH